MIKKYDTSKARQTITTFDSVPPETGGQLIPRFKYFDGTTQFVLLLLQQTENFTAHKAKHHLKAKHYYTQKTFNKQN